MLATMILAALTGTSFPPVGTYRYAASVSGQAIGAWAVSVTRDASHTEIDENSSAAVLGMQLSATASLVLGPDLAPASYAGNYRTATQNPRVSVALTSSGATVIGALTSQPQQFALAANTRHFVVIEPGLLAGLFALPAQLDSWKESSVTCITPATAQAQALTTNAAASLPRPAGVSSGDVLLSIEHPIAVTIWYDPVTLAPDEIIVPSQNAILTRVR